MFIFGLAGWSGSGKTTLLVRLVEEIVARGHTVSTVKHAHHAFDVDTPGKDSHRHRTAGAREVIVASGNRWALMHELRGAREPSLDELITHMTPVDLLLVEGFKHHAHAKLEIWRATHGQPLLAPDDPHIVGVATDSPDSVAPLIKVPILDLNDIPSITEYIIDQSGLEKTRKAKA